MIRDWRKQSIWIHLTRLFIHLLVSIFIPDRNFESHSSTHTSLAFHDFRHSPGSRPTVLPCAVLLPGAMDWRCDHCELRKTVPLRLLMESQGWEPGADRTYIVRPMFLPKSL